MASLNAAHANPQALANAAPGSMPGKLAIYSTAYIAAQAAVDAAQILFDAAQSDLDDALNDLADAQDALAAVDPLDVAGVALAQADIDAAQIVFDDAETALADAQIALDDAKDLDDVALAALTGGGLLSPAALAELLALLGL